LKRSVLTGIVAVFLATSGAAQQAAEKAGLRGVVWHAATDRPVAGARLTLIKAGQILPGRTTGPSAAILEITGIPVESGADGRFEFRDLEPGRYKLTVTANGYVRREFERDSAALTLTAGETMENIAVRLTPAATVTGYVRTPSGRPLAGVTVEVLKRSFNATGEPRVERVTADRTDDRGEYRIFWLTPGRYYVAAGSNPNVLVMGSELSIFDEPRSASTLNWETYPHIFFPASSTSDGASLLALQPGSELRGINFVLDAAKKYRIRGRVVDPATQRPPSGGRIAITGGGTRYLGFDPSTGAFELAGLASGSYTVSLVAEGTPLLETLLGTGPGPLATSRVTITNADIDNLTPVWTVPSVLTGSIRVETASGQTTNLNSLRVNLRNTEGSSRQAAAGADGTFEFRNLPESEYRMSLTGVPAGFYIKEARLNNNDILSAPVRSSTSGSMEITLSANGGQIAGVVMDEARRPVPAISAVLVPANNRERADLFKAAATNAEGRFTFSGIAPGEYKLFAWIDAEPYAYFDSDFLKGFDELGHAVRVVESSTQSVELRVISAAEPR
jgi:protocatechuate 3,4-dioxygenase beta subunit